MSAHADFLHLQLDARHEVKDKVEARQDMRGARRGRNTPCRQPRNNRASLRDNNRLPPSTKARWDWKLRIIRWLTKVFPITRVIVEDINATPKRGQRKWNLSFGPLKRGKNWFYGQLQDISEFDTKHGWETKALRDIFCLSKTRKKLSEQFEAHCVDSFVLAMSGLNVIRPPTTKHLLCLTPLNFRRRSLHLCSPSKGGKRRDHGGTRTNGLRRGFLIRSPDLGLAYLGGNSKKGTSLHDLRTGSRLTQKANMSQCKLLGYNSIRFHWVSP